MKKKMVSLVLVAVMTLTMGACGKKEDAPRYGLVTNTEGIGTESLNAEAWASIQEAAGSEYLYKYYTAEEDTDKGVDEQFDAAADDGTELVFACGTDMESAIFRAQRSHRKTRYVLVDGLPRKNEDDEASFRENTTSIAIATQDEGYIAGYGAVRNGYRKIGFIAGGKDDTNKRYLSGYVQGAEKAAADLNLGSGEIKVFAVYAENDELSPLRMTDALVLYKQGVEVIYAVGENVANAVYRAAQSVSKPFIAGGLDMNSLSANCIFSTVNSYKSAVDAALDDFDTEEGLPGGETVYYGAADKAVRIIADYTRLSSFTETDYNGIVRQIMEGSVEVSGDEMTEGTTHVALTITDPPSGMDESTAAAAGLNTTPAADTGIANTASADTTAETENTEEAASEEEGTGEEEYTEEDTGEEEYSEENGENTEEEYTEENTEEEEQ